MAALVMAIPGVQIRTGVSLLRACLLSLLSGGPVTCGGVAAWAVAGCARACCRVLGWWVLLAVGGLVRVRSGESRWWRGQRARGGVVHRSARPVVWGEVSAWGGSRSPGTPLVSTSRERHFLTSPLKKGPSGRTAGAGPHLVHEGPAARTGVCRTRIP